MIFCFFFRDPDFWRYGRCSWAHFKILIFLKTYILLNPQNLHASNNPDIGFPYGGPSGDHRYRGEHPFHQVHGGPCYVPPSGLPCGAEARTDHETKQSCCLAVPTGPPQHEDRVEHYMVNNGS